jgi:hypothetical protein
VRLVLAAVAEKDFGGLHRRHPVSSSLWVLSVYPEAARYLNANGRFDQVRARLQRPP